MMTSDLYIKGVVEEGLRGFLPPSLSRSSWVQSRMQEKDSSDPEALSEDPGFDSGEDGMEAF